MGSLFDCVFGSLILGFLFIRDSFEVWVVLSILWCILTITFNLAWNIIQK